MRDHRLLFEKTGLGVYVSHLDLMRTVQRAFIRAGLHVKHTEGFNPRPYMVFALPLPVGCGSVCELVDLSLESDHASEELPSLLAPFLPEGIRPVAAYMPQRKFKEIKWLKIEGLLQYPKGVPAGALEAVQAALTGPTLVVRRKTKRGEDYFDLIPHLTDVELTAEEGHLKLTVMLSAQEPTVNPALITAALAAHVPDFAPAFAEYTRLELYDAQRNRFR